MNIDEDSDNGSVDDLVGDEDPDQQKETNAKGKLAAEETKAVNILRLLSIVVLVGVAATVCAVVYQSLRASEQEKFENEFSFLADKILDGVQDNSRQRLESLELFSAQITSHALASDESFPMVTLPHFALKADYAQSLSRTIATFTFMIVEEDERADWEEYSVANAGWQVDHAYYKARNDPEATKVIDAKVANGTALSTLEHISNRGGNETAPGPYAVYWQFAPTDLSTPLVNYNGYTFGSRGIPINETVQSGALFVNKAIDLTNTTDFFATRRRVGVISVMDDETAAEYEDGPVSDIYLPIFDSFEEGSAVRGVMSSYLWWQGWFTSLLPPGSNGLIVVLRSDCDDTYTFEINGESARYIGAGDKHETKYDGLVASSKLFPDEAGTSSPLHCSYNITVFPSRTLEEEYTTSGPLWFTLGLLATFVFTSTVFILYDCFVQRRHTVVNDTAVQSSAVVSNLFPAKVRDRMVSTMYANEPDKVKKDAFLNQNLPQNKADDDLPIADLYENCSVLFSDMAGFTCWSNKRTPTDVFNFLEKVYGAFDQVAKKYRIFKVETIGDCYVAVAGLPEPQPRHATLMCRFAHECNIRLSELMPSLIEIFGDDTAEIGMRCGIHSGPVTAGVLRGERARFQIFGDTVNTASRMETNGKKGKIHVSKQTAEFLDAAGKQSWTAPRDEFIDAKGLGSIQTFWLKVTSIASTETNTVHSTDNASMGDTDEPMVLSDPRHPNKTRRMR